MGKDNGQHHLKIRDLDQERREMELKDLKQRVKELLKEPDNLKCSECHSKKHKPKFMCLIEAAPPVSTTSDQVQQGSTTSSSNQVGVFCCKDCKEFLQALGPKCSHIKSLKEPETWTEHDVSVLERSGNKTVNAIYLSALEGYHSEKQMGSLASAGYVSSKYKQGLFYREGAYHEQMQLRAMILFEKNPIPQETFAPSAEDKLKSALKRQQNHQSSETHSTKDDAKSNEEEGVLLRGFGPAPPATAATTTTATTTTTTTTTCTCTCSKAAPSDAINKRSSHRKPMRRIKSSSAHARTRNTLQHESDDVVEGKVNNNNSSCQLHHHNNSDHLHHHRRSRQRIRGVTSSGDNLMLTRRSRSRSSSRDDPVVPVLQRSPNSSMRQRNASFRPSRSGSRQKGSPGNNTNNRSSSSSPSKRLLQMRSRGRHSTSLSPNRPVSINRARKPQPKLDSNLDDGNDSESSLSLDDIGSFCDDNDISNNDTSASSLSSDNPSHNAKNLNTTTTTGNNDESMTRGSYQTRQLLADAVTFAASDGTNKSKVEIPQLLKSIPNNNKPDQKKVHRHTTKSEEAASGSSSTKGRWQKREEAAKVCTNNNNSSSINNHNNNSSSVFALESAEKSISALTTEEASGSSSTKGRWQQREEAAKACINNNNSSSIIINNNNSSSVFALESAEKSISALALDKVDSASNPRWSAFRSEHVRKSQKYVRTYLEPIWPGDTCWRWIPNNGVAYSVVFPQI